MKTLADVKPALLADPAAQAEYTALGPEFDIIRELITARCRAGLTQAHGHQPKRDCSP
jgi:hypothetical protein